MFPSKVLLLVVLKFAVNLTLFSQYKSAAFNEGKNREIVPGQFIVKFKSPLGKISGVNTSSLSNAVAKYNVESSKQLFSDAKNDMLKEKLNLNNVYVMKTDKSADIQKIVDELNKELNVEYAEPVYICEMDSEPNDPRYSDQFHLRQVKAPEAWDIQKGDSTIIIGVVDTGVDWDHEDLAEVIWSNTDEIPNNGIDDDGNGYIDDIRGWDFVTGVSGSDDNDAHPSEDGGAPDNNPMDFAGHGTHVAGIAAAHTNNNIGIASVSYGVKVMPLRIGYRTNAGGGLGYSSWMAEAFIYAADNGAHVANLSFGNSGQAIKDAAYYAFKKGMLITVSAGNDNKNSPSTLCSQEYVISVASVKNNDTKAGYSNFGENVEVSAPGGSSGNYILSTIVHPSSFYGGNKYTQMQGTSMAAPLVASAAALVKSHEPSLSVIDLFSRIVETTDNINDINPNHRELLGSGRINVYRALTENVYATPKFNVISSTIDDGSGNNNGILDPGENVNLKVKLRSVWQSASQVSLELKSNTTWPISISSGTFNGGSIGGVLNKNNQDIEAVFTISAFADAIPFTNKFDLVINADGSKQTIKLIVSVSPQVLFVADFSQSNNEIYDFSDIYINALENSNVSFDYLHRLHTTVTSEILNNYQTVVWACEARNPSLNGADRNAIKSFLNNGGSLFISGQDIGWDLNKSGTNTDITFYNEYLMSNFIANDINKSEMFGVDLDPISDSLAFIFHQDKRTNNQQTPDVIEPIDGAISIFNYDDGQSGAIRYSGDYDLVYFGFGGFESISDSITRNYVMEKVINWLIIGDYTLEKLKDSESPAIKFPVHFSIANSALSLNNVQLFWDIDSEQPFNKISMTNLGDGNYVAEIPAQAQNTTVEYYVYAEVENGGSLRTESYSFFIGNDLQSPTIIPINKFSENSVRAFGPEPAKLKVSLLDNLGIDTLSAKIHYTVNDISPYSNNLMKVVSIEKGIFEGSFSFTEPLNLGDKVSYYFSAADSSSNANSAESDIFEYFIDTTEVLDDFENGLINWDVEGEWNLSETHNSGQYSLAESPEEYYEDNLDISATYLLPFNLSNYKNAELNFYLKSLIKGSDKDSLFVEVSNDRGLTWKRELLCPFAVIRFSLQRVDLTDYTGAGMENINFRFRFVSDSSGVFDGVWIDDVNIKVSDNTATGISSNIDEYPQKYSLSQNYPNPFNPSTVINYSLPKRSLVELKIFNILGQEAATLVNKFQPAGEYKVNFNASGLSNGIYFYRIRAGEFEDSRKMILLR